MNWIKMSLIRGKNLQEGPIGQHWEANGQFWNFGTVFIGNSSWPQVIMTVLLIWIVILTCPGIFSQVSPTRRTWRKLVSFWLRSWKKPLQRLLWRKLQLLWTGGTLYKCKSRQFKPVQVFCWRRRRRGNLGEDGQEEEGGETEGGEIDYYIKALLKLKFSASSHSGDLRHKWSGGSCQWIPLLWPPGHSLSQVKPLLRHLCIC